jgi:hypothetical protein
MGDWYEIFDDIFFVSIATLTFSFMGVVIKSMLASKCDRVNLCWGLVNIHREVALEVQGQQQENQPVAHQPSSQNLNEERKEV